jgi:hypothetical protein
MDLIKEVFGCVLRKDVAQAGLDLYVDEPSGLSPEEDEIQRLRAKLAVETHLKEEWIAEYVKLRDGDNSPTAPSAH